MGETELKTITRIPPVPISDGLDALRAEMSLGEIMRLIERTARWVSTETFRRLPVWYPEHSRRGLFYKRPAQRMLSELR